MFSNLGLFKHIACPNRDDCSLLGCIFSHENSNPLLGQNEINQETEYDPLTAGETISPPAKRRKLDAIPVKSPVHEDELPLPAASTRTVESRQLGSDRTVEPQVSAVQTKVQPKVILRQIDTPKRHKDSSFDGKQKSTENSHQKAQKKTAPDSFIRPVSPPNFIAGEKKSAREPRTVHTSKPEQLIPRNVVQAPAVHKTRLTILQALYQNMLAQNKKVETEDNETKSCILEDQEIVKLALDEEEEAATKLKEGIYRNSMAQKIQKFKKMNRSEWENFVKEKILTTPDTVKAGENAIATSAGHITTGLASNFEEIEILKRIQTPLDGLEKYGYVTTRPSDAAISSSKSAIKASSGFETCDRCGTRFRVFPGRDHHGRLTTAGKCCYHWARLVRSTSKDGYSAKSEATYGCCNRVLGSLGCTEFETHVFKVSDVVRLATVLQFEQTPKAKAGEKKSPVAFDCEMAYTTLGMEVIRVTAVSWPQGQKLLDILVRPYGEILDLNTRFSGVSNEQFATALPCENIHAETLSDVQISSLCKVESPAAARQFLFNILTDDTPLIGHAIENDLNVCRIIHPFVIDTVLLYPHPRGLPIRYSLKILAQKYLNRGIQLEEQSGHDSKEDAIATADLVTIKVREKWKLMRLEGWFFHGEMLTSANEKAQPTSRPKAAL